MITRGIIPCGKRIVVYGVEGIGKTTFAAQMPGAVFIDTEGSTRSFDVARFPAPQSWAALLQMVEYARTHPHEVGTLIIDTADWAEKLCNAAVCAKAGKSGIEDFGYGKGYTYSAEEFGKLLDALEKLSQGGTHVCITAHAVLQKVEQPDEMGSYDKYTLKCSKQIAPMLKEWADALLFANYKTFVVRNEAGKGKAQGGQRVIYTSHRPAWDAKNRFGLPDEMPMEFAAFAPLFGNQPAPVVTPAISAAQEPQPRPTPAATNAAPQVVTPPASAQTAPSMPDAPVTQPVPAPVATTLPDYTGIHPKLVELMKAEGITPEEVQEIVGEKRYFPPDMPVKDYPADFVEGCLVAAWEQVSAAITEKNNFGPLPF